MASRTTNSWTTAAAAAALAVLVTGGAACVARTCTSEDDHDLDGAPGGFCRPSGGDSDCDDTDPGINPRAIDVPGDGVDQDCDGLDATGDGGVAACGDAGPCDAGT